jgi:hypothetical protein
VPVPFVPILIALLVLAVFLMAVFGLRLRGSLRRLSTVRGALRDHVSDRSGMLRARSAALSVAVSDMRQYLRGHRPQVGAPRTIGTSVEREDHRGAV